MLNILNSIFLISGRHSAFNGVPPMVMIGFALVSTSLIFLGIFLSQKRKMWLQHSHLTQGEIVEVSKRYDRGDHLGRYPIFFPVVSFIVNEKQFKIEADKGMSIISQVGQKMQVRYNPENPYESALGERNIPGIKPSVFFALGTGLFMACILLVL